MSDSAALLEQGLQHENEGRFEEAVGIYQDVIDREPSNAMAYLYKGLARVRDSEYKLALADLEKASEINPKIGDVDPESELGKRVDWAIKVFEWETTVEPNSAPVHLQLARALKAFGKLDRAQTAVGMVIQLHPDNWDAAYMTAKIAMLQGRYDTAVKELQQLVRGRSNEPNLQHELGLAYDRMGSGGPAQRHLEKACALDPGIPEYRLSLADLALRQGRFQNAVQGFESALKLAPGHPGALLGLARCHRAQYQFEQALEVYGRALEARPGDSDIEAEQAEVFLQVGQPEKALATLVRQAERNPDDPQNWMKVAKAAEESDNLSRALDAYQRVLAMDTKNHAVWGSLAEVQARGGQFEDALHSLEQAAHLEPGEPRYVVARLAILARGNRVDQARELAMRAGAQHPASFELQLQAGMAFLELGRYEEAWKALSSAVRLRPDQAQAQWALGQVFLRQQRLEEAFACFRAALKIQPKHLGTLLGLAQVSRLRGELEMAQDFLDQAMEMQPGALPLVEETGHLAVAQKQPAAAAAVVARLVEAVPDPNRIWHLVESWSRGLGSIEPFNPFARRYPGYPPAEALLVELSKPAPEPVVESSEEVVEEQVLESGEGVVEEQVLESGEEIVEEQVLESGEEIVEEQVLESGEEIVEEQSADQPAVEEAPPPAESWPAADADELVLPVLNAPVRASSDFSPFPSWAAEESPVAEPAAPQDAFSPFPAWPGGDAPPVPTAGPISPAVESKAAPARTVKPPTPRAPAVDTPSSEAHGEPEVAVESEPPSAAIEVAAEADPAVEAGEPEAPEPEPVAETPEVAPEPEPVAETPEVAPEPEPLAETPEVAPEPEPVAETPEVAPEPEPVAETPEVAPEPEPVAEAPEDVPEQQPENSWEIPLPGSPDPVDQLGPRHKLGRAGEKALELPRSQAQAQADQTATLRELYRLEKQASEAGLWQGMEHSLAALDLARGWLTMAPQSPPVREFFLTHSLDLASALEEAAATEEAVYVLDSCLDLIDEPTLRLKLAALCGAQARERAQEGSLPEAVRLAQRRVELLPELPESNVLRDDFLQRWAQAGPVGAELRAFERARKRAGLNLTVKTRVRTIDLEEEQIAPIPTGNPEELRALLLENPEDRSLHLQLEELLQGEERVLYYRELVNQKTDSMRFLAGLARAYAATGQFQLAVVQFQKALKQGSDPEMSLELAEVYDKLGKPKLADKIRAKLK